MLELTVFMAAFLLAAVGSAYVIESKGKKRK